MTGSCASYSASGLADERVAPAHARLVGGLGHQQDDDADEQDHRVERLAELGRRNQRRGREDAGDGNAGALAVLLLDAGAQPRRAQPLPRLVALGLELGGHGRSMRRGLAVALGSDERVELGDRVTSRDGDVPPVHLAPLDAEPVAVAAEDVADVIGVQPRRDLCTCRVAVQVSGAAVVREHRLHRVPTPEQDRGDIERPGRCVKTMACAGPGAMA